MLTILGVVVGMLAVASVLITFGNGSPTPSGAWYNKPIDLINCQELRTYDAASIKPNLQRDSSFEDSAKASRELARLKERADTIGGCSGSENW